MPAGDADQLAVVDRGDQFALGGREVGVFEVGAAHDRGDLGGGEADRVGEHRVGGALRRRPALQRRIEVGERVVVGLEGLEAADLEPAPVGHLEDHRRRRVADRPVGARSGGSGRGWDGPRRSGSALCPPRRSRRSPGRRCGRRPPPRRARRPSRGRRAGRSSSSSRPARRELHQLDRAQRRVAELHRLLTGGDHRAAGARAGRQPRTSRRRRRASRSAARSCGARSPCGPAV